MAKNKKTIIVLLAAAFVTTGGSISAEISKDDISKIVGANTKPFHQVWDDPSRLATINVAMDGTVLVLNQQVSKKNRRTDDGKFYVKRSEDGGKTWSQNKAFGKNYILDWEGLQIGPYDGKGWGHDEHHKIAHMGSNVVDEVTGEIMVFINALYPAPYVYKSKDHGKTWKLEPILIRDDSRGFKPVANAASDPGFTLRRGPHKGRLVISAALLPNASKPSESQGYASIIYSDDHGVSWTSSEPFPVRGTGEPSLVQLKNGTLLLCARRSTTLGNKWIAYSDDSGETLRDCHEDDELFDGPPDMYGCNASMIRLDRDNYDILLFSSPDPTLRAGKKVRHNIKIWVSFDGGKTWPHNKLLKEGHGSYTVMVEGRKATPSQGFIYVHSRADWMARFNMAWLLEDADLKKINQAMK